MKKKKIGILRMRNFYVLWFYFHTIENKNTKRTVYMFYFFIWSCNYCFLNIFGRTIYCVMVFHTSILWRHRSWQQTRDLLLTLWIRRLAYRLTFLLCFQLQLQHIIFMSTTVQWNTFEWLCKWIKNILCTKNCLWTTDSAECIF